MPVIKRESRLTTSYISIFKIFQNIGGNMNAHADKDRKKKKTSANEKSCVLRRFFTGEQASMPKQ